MSIRSTLLALLVFLAGTAQADSLEIYSLSFRPAEEIIPLLAPHLPPGASLSGQGNQLIVRAPAKEQREVTRLIRELDVAPQSLRISVRTGSDVHRERSGVGGQGRIGGGEGSASLRVYRSEDARAERLSQQVRALEGRPAFIAESVLLPITDRSVVIGREQIGVQERTQLIELNRGFFAIAHLQGDGRVRIDIATDDSGAGSPRTGIRRHRVVSSIEGATGEWLPVGQTQQGAQRQDSGLLYRSRDARGENRSVWLKVDRLD